MTVEETAALRTYVRNLADQLGLSNWEIEFDEVPSTTAAGAFIRDYMYRVTLRFAEDFRDTPPIEQITSVVHELLHCVLAGADNVVRVDLADSEQISLPAFTLLKTSYSRQSELAVESLARALAGFLPAIEWPTGEGTI